ncbi:alpha/beta fold hydrolase [Streptomyces sp. C10-9-1]|uniref:esterase/lipase family protein n=1 Tax=Streptomyces sp. C10-9-1 TaxID=1859285 RepID=UPI0021115760|nr:alpha/beta fold hydrolase [Streptomyces sp. C10-9-1]MCQ6555274.1 alpha/beta fold hydrolase [Streptomyces sp. C10-9-1]
MAAGAARCLRGLGRFRLPADLLRATTLELLVLAGHVALYPSGLAPERPRPGRGPGAGVPGPGADGDGTAHPAAGGPAQPPGSGPEAGALHTLPPLAAGGTAPALLLHGFADNRSVFVLLRRALAQDGQREVRCLNFSPLTRDIRAAAELLGRRVEEICARTGHPRLDVVGHSLGGLIARYYVQRLGGDRRVRTLVTLGTPHAGTSVVPLAGVHPVVRQMRPGSEVIEELTRPAPGCRTRFVCFWSDLDRIMSPVETARIVHPDLLVEDVPVRGIGHLALPVHPAVTSRVREALAPTGEQGACGAAGRGGTASVA